MSEFALWIAAFSGMIAISVFISIVSRRKSVHPTLFLGAKIPVSKNVIPKNVLVFAETALDIIAGIAIAAFISLYSSNKTETAILVDTSPSMFSQYRSTRGTESVRPIDRAIGWILKASDPNASVFMVGHHLDGEVFTKPLEMPLADIRRPEAMSDYFRQNATSLEITTDDLQKCADIISHEGYGELTFICDEIGAAPLGFSIIQTGFAARPFISQGAISYLPGDGKIKISWASGGIDVSDVTIALWSSDEIGKPPKEQVKAALFPIAGESGIEAVTDKTGIYVATVDTGLIQAKAGILARPIRVEIVADEGFCSKVASIFESNFNQSEKAGSLTLKEKKYMPAIFPTTPSEVWKIIEKPRNDTAFSVSTGAPYETVIPFWMSGGSLIGGGLSRDGEFPLSRETVANADTVMIFSRAVSNARGLHWISARTARERGADIFYGDGIGFAFIDDEWIPLAADVGESIYLPGKKPVSFKVPAQPPKWALYVLFAAITLKIILSIFTDISSRKRKTSIK